MADTGRQILVDLLCLGDKDPKDFLVGYEAMLEFLQDQHNWPAIQSELEARNVKAMTFYDVVLDFIILDAFKDLDAPPASVTAVVNNRFLSNGFKETVNINNFFHPLQFYWINYNFIFLIGIDDCCLVGVESQTSYVEILKWFYGTFLRHI